mgnify:CR=1 FL=1
MPYLTDDPIDTPALRRAVMRDSDGACIVFEGVVRDHHEGRRVESIFYEAYRPMAEKEIDAVIKGVEREFPAVAVAVAHRRDVAFNYHRDVAAAEFFLANDLDVGRLAGTVDRLEDGREAQALEPPRGSRSQVSLVIVAVHDGGVFLIQALDRFFSATMAAQRPIMRRLALTSHV